MSRRSCRRAGELRKACVECHARPRPASSTTGRAARTRARASAASNATRPSEGDADAFEPLRQPSIATVVTPRDCGRCHQKEARSSAAATTPRPAISWPRSTTSWPRPSKGHACDFNPHSPDAGRSGLSLVNGMASVFLGCKQCHGSKIALEATDGGTDHGRRSRSPTPTASRPTWRRWRGSRRATTASRSSHAGTWPNTGIGRLNLDGSRGSCSACHCRHDFSPRRARQPENCGKCHLGPDHPQKEIYEESKHGVAYRDLRDQMNLDAKDWVLGEDYAQAPTCATCHMSGHSRNGGKVTHDPGERHLLDQSPAGQPAAWTPTSTARSSPRPIRRASATDRSTAGRDKRNA